MAELPGENEAQRLNRNFDDLLQELRVSQNGTQILFAFLLTVPFQSGFSKTTSFERDLYFATLLVAALSAALFITPAVMHRVLFRQHMKAELVRTAGYIALGGQALTTFAVAGSVLLVGEYLFSATVGAILSVATLLWWGGWFFAFPLWLRAVHRRQDATASSR